MLDWLEANAEPLLVAPGPTNGSTTLWYLDDDTLARGAAQGIGYPSATYETER
jgi:hypothetical protein